MDEIQQVPILSLDWQKHIPIASTRLKLHGRNTLRANSKGFKLMTEFLDEIAQRRIASGSTSVTIAEDTHCLMHRIHAEDFHFVQPISPPKDSHEEWSVTNSSWEYMTEQHVSNFLRKCISARVKAGISDEAGISDDEEELAALAALILTNEEEENGPLNQTQDSPAHVLKTLTKYQIPIIHHSCHGAYSFREANKAHNFFNETCDATVEEITSGNTPFSYKDISVGLFKSKLAKYSFVRPIEPKSCAGWNVETTEWEVLSERDAIRFMAQTIQKKFHAREIETIQPSWKKGRVQGYKSEIHKKPPATRRPDSSDKVQKPTMSLKKHQIPIIHSNCLGSFAFRGENKASEWFNLRCEAIAQKIAMERSISIMDISRKLVRKDFYGYSFARAVPLKAADQWNVETTGWLKVDEQESILYTAGTLSKKLAALRNAAKQDGISRKKFTALKNASKRDGITYRSSGLGLGSRHIPIVHSTCSRAIALREGNKNFQLLIRICRKAVKAFFLAQNKKGSPPSHMEMVETLVDTLENKHGLTFVQAAQPRHSSPKNTSSAWVHKETRWVKMDRSSVKSYLSKRMRRMKEAFDSDVTRKRSRGNSLSPVTQYNRDTKRLKMKHVVANNVSSAKLLAQQKSLGSEKLVETFNPSAENHIPRIHYKCSGSRKLREQSVGYIKLMESCIEEAKKSVDLHRDILLSGQSPVVSHKEAAMKMLPQFHGVTFFRASKKKGLKGEWTVENALWEQMDKDQIVDFIAYAISHNYTKAVDRLKTSFKKDQRRSKKVELFESLLNRAAKKLWGTSIEEKESGFAVRKANFDSKLNGCWAPYGRMLPAATDRILLDVLELSHHDTFVDIGHGLGNAVLQAAYTIGCESRGIEVVDSRFLLSEQLRDGFETVVKRTDSMTRLMSSGRSTRGQVHLVHGGLEMKEHRDFLSRASGDGVIKAFADNFNGVFADRCSTGDKVWLDHSIAGLFARMPPGSKLVTLHELSMIPSRSVANAERVDRKSLAESTEASFYEMEKVILGKANKCFSWSSKGSNEQDVVLYVYTRLPQDSCTAVFLCANPCCEHSKPDASLCATKIVTGKDGAERLVLNDACPTCDYNLRPSRSRIIKDED